MDFEPSRSVRKGSSRRAQQNEDDELDADYDSDDEAGSDDGDSDDEVSSHAHGSPSCRVPIPML